MMFGCLDTRQMAAVLLRSSPLKDGQGYVLTPAGVVPMHASFVSLWDMTLDSKKHWSMLQITSSCLIPLLN